jgi:hypothetical protein
VEPATIPHAHDPAALADDAHAAACAESSRRGDLRISAAGERGRDGAPVAYLLGWLVIVLAGLSGTALGWWLALASGAL